MTDHYINTYPAAEFSLPDGMEDYAEWLTGRYEACKSIEGGMNIYFGIAQRINVLMVAAERGQSICAIGPHAAAAAQVLLKMSKGVLQAEVLK